MNKPHESRRDKELQNLRDEIERLRRRFNLLSHLSRKIASSLNLGSVLQDIVDAACELTYARYGALAIFDDSGRILQFITHGMSSEDRKRLGDLPIGLGILGLLQESQEPLRLADLTKHPRSVGFPPHHPPMRTFLGVPIILDDEAMGNIYLTDKDHEDEFTPEDEKLIIMFADQAAMAIRNARRFTGEQEAHAQFRAIIDNSAAGVVVVHAPDGKVLLANREASEILGVSLNPGDSSESYENAVTYRKSDGDIYAIEDLPLQRALREGVITHGTEVVFDIPSGRKIPMLVNASPVYDAEGNITAAIAVFDDITERKRVEEELERVRREFLGMVSHDLRGPLATIKGLSSSLLMDDGPRSMETILDYVNTIDEESDRMADLVGNLLDMSRIEAGSMPFEPEICHLADIVSESVRRVQRSRIGGSYHIVQDVPLELPEIYADYDQIGRVMANLLSNAIKYSPDGVEIAVSSYLDPEDTDKVITEVKDQGVGIPESEMENIFTKFYRVTTERGRGRPGSGLGLAICKAIVEGQGGNIWVESQQGKGSRFKFRLPVSVPGVSA